MATDDRVPQDSELTGTRPEGRHAAQRTADRTDQTTTSPLPGTAPAPGRGTAGGPTAPAAGAHLTRGAASDAVAAQHERFGGIKWGTAFFGWLSANGLAVILLALVSAAGVGIGLANGVDTADEAADRARTVGLAGGIALLVVLFLAYLAGGYVAGRMARFDGARQGLAVWVIGLVVVVVLAAAGWVLGSQYNVLRDLNLPRIPVDEGTATTAGVITLVAILVVTVAGALLGGVLGTRYHRRIDRVGAEA